MSMQLKRFVFIQASGTTEKINDKIKYDDEIDLSTYSNNMNDIFKLIGVVVYLLFIIFSVMMVVLVVVVIIYLIVTIMKLINGTNIMIQVLLNHTLMNILLIHMHIYCSIKEKLNQFQVLV